MSSPTPQAAVNPSILVADSSAIIPLVLAEEMQTLRELESRYGISCVVMPVVEGELIRNVQRRFPDRLGTLKKAFSNGTLKVLDESLLTNAGYKSASAIVDQIDTLSLQYAKRVDRGEAYTHAASNILGIPALSQDIAALWKLVDSGVRIHRPVLRSFDIIILGLQIGVLSDGDCKAIRRELLKRGEAILPCFQNCSVSDGLANFYQRICDGKIDVIGAPNPLDRFDDRIWIMPRE